MNLRLVKASEEYRSQISDMMNGIVWVRKLYHMQSVEWIIGILKITVIA